MSTSEPMSSVDRAWLRMDSPTNPMTITGLMVFGEPLDAAWLRRTLEERFLCYPRFRRLAVAGPGTARWEADPHFDLRRHLHRLALPGDGGKGELETLTSDLVSTALDPARPRWEFHLVERYRGGSALILRIHHCYADGIALVRVIRSLADGVAPVGAPEDEPVGGLTGLALALGRSLLGQGLDLAREPTRIGARAREGAAVAAEVARLLLLADDPPTCLRGPLGASKRVAWADPLALGEVRAVGRTLGCSVNDVLLAAVTGALRAYLVGRGQTVDRLTLRAAVPVNLRAAGAGTGLGNRFGLVFLPLPVGIDNPLERLYRVHAAMETLKASPQALVTFGLLGTLGLAPEALQSQALDLLGRKVSAVMTNVPGPREPFCLAGARMTEAMFWVPQSAGVGLGVSLLSYDGGLHFGLVADESLVPDPASITRRFGAEFEGLLLTALMLPWPGVSPGSGG